MKQLTVIFLFIWLAISANAQKTKTVTDRFGVQGIISYSGTYYDSILPEKNKFELKWRNIFDDTLTTFSTQGTLKNHKPHGKWLWEEAGWDYIIEPSKTIYPSFQMEGLHHVWQGSFVNGVVSGDWIYGLGKPTVNLRSSKTPLLIKTKYKNGKPVGAFSVADNRNEEAPVFITGQCDEKGVATGKWKFNFYVNNEKIIENRIYDQGLLIEIQRETSQSKDTMTFYVVKEQISTLSDSNQMVIIGNKNFSTDGEYSESQALFAKYMHDYFLCGWKLPAFKFNVEREAPGFKRLAYPLSLDEQNIRTEIELLLTTLYNQVGGQLKKGNLFINRNRSHELDLAVAVFEQAEKRLAVIDSFVRHSYRPDFIYYDRKNGDLKPWLRKINETRKVQGVAFPENIIHFAQLKEKKDVYTVFKTILDDLVALNKYLTPHLNQIEQSFKAMKREGELQKMEALMTKDLKQLDRLYSEMDGIGKHIREYWIQHYFNLQVQQYAQTDDYKTAKKLGKSLLIKMDSLVAWADTWEFIDNINKHLTESYINFAYNPYTGDHDIELPIKKRCINNVKEVLVPYLIKNIEEAENWETFTESLVQFNEVIEMLVDFAHREERAARRIERKIRKEDQPEKIIRLLTNYMAK